MNLKGVTPSRMKKLLLSIGMTVIPKSGCKYGEEDDSQSSIMKYIQEPLLFKNIIYCLLDILRQEKTEIKTTSHTIRVHSMDGIHSISSSKVLSEIHT